MENQVYSLHDRQALTFTGSNGECHFGKKTMLADDSSLVSRI